MPIVLLPIFLVRLVYRSLHSLYRKWKPYTEEELQAMRYRAKQVVTEEFGEGEKRPLTPDVEKGLRSQIYSLQKADLAGYSYESHASNFEGARADIMVYDSAGKTQVMGREFGKRLVFWQNN